MHLCANMLLGRVLPEGGRIRRTFTFDAGEKDFFNRLYRYALDALVDGNSFQRQFLQHLTH